MLTDIVQGDFGDNGWDPGPRKPLSPPPKPPEELGFYMPDSPYAKMDNTFDPDKVSVTELARPAHQLDENDVVSDKHVGRKWSMTLALMTLKTGAFRKAPGVKGPLGGYVEEGLNHLVNDCNIQEAKESFLKQMRAAARKMTGAQLKSEKKRLQSELLSKVKLKQMSNVPQKQHQTPPTSPGADSDISSPGAEEEEA